MMRLVREERIEDINYSNKGKLTSAVPPLLLRRGLGRGCVNFDYCLPTADLPQGDNLSASAALGISPHKERGSAVLLNIKLFRECLRLFQFN